MVKWLLGAVNESVGLPGQRLFNINDVDEYGRTLLHYAILEKHLTIAEFLLGLPEINAGVTDIFGQTPLSYAAESSYTQIIDLISQKTDVNPNCYDGYGRMPLHRAIQKNHVETVKILLRLPNTYVGPFHPSPRGARGDLDSPLKVMAELGYVDIVDLLLKHPDTDPNWKGHGHTPLVHAIVEGYMEIVNLLLQHSDIQPNLMSGQIMPPVSWAIAEHRMGMVKRLLQHPDADVNCRDSKGCTPLSWAAFWDYEEAVEFLLQHPDIQLDIPDEFGQTPLMIAAMNGYLDSQVGLNTKLDSFGCSCRDNHLCAPLSYAAAEGHQDIVQFLLEHDDFHNGPRDDVSMAEWIKRPTVVHLLFPDQRNLDPSSRHRQHFNTLINYALQWGYTRIAAILCQHVDTEDTLGADSWK
ncbi:ankyrin repeat-containing domain protein [Mycena floridula]|nr:ankyrin repeat-containing domain protein [Mycena floridula]